MGVVGVLPENIRIVSGVSSVSEIDRGHLRGLSETSVSSDGNYATPMQGGAPMSELPVSNIVKPTVSPLGSSRESGNHLSGAPASPSPSQSRKSNFAEGFDEVKR